MTGLLKVPPPLRMHPRRPLEVLAPGPLGDAELRVQIRDALSAEVFEHARWRALWVPLHAIVALAGTFWLARAVAQPLVLGLVALAVANAWACMFWIGQEVGHGAVTPSARIRGLSLWLAGLPFCLPPRLWHTWHATLHHGYTNVPGRDPDHREPVAGTPVMRTAALLLGLAAGTTVRVQRVLWLDSARPGFPRFARFHARFEGACLAAIWLAAAWLCGPRSFVAIVLPLAGANALVGMYALTQHRPRRSRAGGDTLDTTTSVRVPRLLDRLHFHASHHVEHHLFPTLASRHYPRVRELLLEGEPERFAPLSLGSALAHRGRQEGVSGQPRAESA